MNILMQGARYFIDMYQISFTNCVFAFKLKQKELCNHYSKSLGYDVEAYLTACDIDMNLTVLMNTFKRVLLVIYMSST